MIIFLLEIFVNVVYVMGSYEVKVFCVECDFKIEYV